MDPDRRAGDGDPRAGGRGPRRSDPPARRRGADPGHRGRRPVAARARPGPDRDRLGADRLPQGAGPAGGRRARPLREYLARREATPATAGDQYALGLWCEERKLTGPAENHYRRAVELDKDFGPAHKKLGHVLQEGRWLTYDELREAQGLIKHKGRWITREEKGQIDARDAVAAEQAAWTRRLKVLREAILTGAEAARGDSRRQVMDIRDPMAVAPLVQAFGRDAGPIRALLVQALGGIAGPEADAALVARLFDEDDAPLRLLVLDELARRRDPETVSRLVRTLGHANPQVVGRAAWALAGLGAVSAVPKLVPALVSVRQRIVWIPTESASPAGPGYGFGPAAPGTGAGPIPVGGPYVPVLTGPVVAPGVIAYGATSVPLYNLPGPSLSAGRPQLPSYRRKVVRSVYRNAEVLDALGRLTGQDFGYDVAAWRRWLTASFRPEPRPARRVPQP
jgi:hypothetical protein